jgi:deoxyribose-phosphate aldolase
VAMNDLAFIANTIDHTLLRPDATFKDFEKLCQEALRHNFFSVCVNSSAVAFCKKQLLNHKASIVSVVGFPTGACLSSAKAFEAEAALRAGANEIDMVIALGALKDRRFREVESDIKAVVSVTSGSILKVILETHLLNDEETVLACKVSEQAGAAFVKTSTGFSGGGATVEDVILMKKSIGNSVSVKASGGIKTLAQAQAMLAAGASRLGTSSGVSILTGQNNQ